jgi:hypothetical protein
VIPPVPPPPFVTVREVKGCSVQFTWTRINNVRGVKDVRYDIVVQGANNQWSRLPDQCDRTGRTFTCIVTMNVLSESPYYLTKGSRIIAKGRAVTGFGNSVYSTASSQTVLMKPLAKKQLTLSSSVSGSNLILNWSRGFSSADKTPGGRYGYALFWDSGNNG